MGFDDCYQIGYIVKAHGLQGEVNITLDVDFPDDYKGLESVLLSKGGSLIPFFIRSISIKGNKAHILFEDIEDKVSAKDLIGSSLWLPLDQLPDLQDDQYYFHELIGCKLYDGKTLIGEVQQVYEMPNNHLLGVEKGEHEILIPLQEEILTKVDVQNKLIIADLPEGLVDVYTTHEN
ncbi:MAG: 16S rRNA processing protein RimM [Cyclobacteriaceae bacterium]|nr:16S rRNA processing protein RimM [Cyclobacteriaceae bacterium HetDA_MAG_MS6]